MEIIARNILVTSDLQKIYFTLFFYNYETEKLASKRRF